MAKAEYQAASDDLLARVAPPWSEEKLRILGAYLDGFARACKSVGTWYALDAFAGGGLNISKTSGQEIKGSPLIALEAQPPKAALVVACEKHDGARAALEIRSAPYGSRVHIEPGDANERIKDLLALIPTGAPSFAFLDPEGSELAWTTVEAVAAHKDKRYSKMEQLILFPTDMGFVRLLDLNKPLKPEHAEMVTRMYGDERWIPIFEDRRAERINAFQARERYLDAYVARLRDDLGYVHVQERQIVKPSGHPMYFLVHATDNDTGEKIMDHCFNKKHLRVEEEAGGLVPMFHVPVAPRKRRGRREPSS